MKSILLFILSFSVAFSSFSQTEFRLDSLYQYSWNVGIPDWQHDNTEKYTYGNGGVKETYILGLFKNGPNFDNSYQSDKSYNANNNITLEVRKSWNLATMVWVDSQRIVYVYNASDLLESETTEISNGMGGWITWSKVIYDYNGSGNLSEETQQETNFATMMLENRTRILFNYTGMNATNQTDQEWNSADNDWENIEKADIIYTSGEPTFAEYSYWNSGMMDWDPPYERDTATYVSGLVSEVLTESFDMGVWVYSDLSTFTYTNLLTENLEQVWDGVDWVNEARVLNTFDTDGNNTQLIFEEWDGADWVGLFKQDRFYSPADGLGIEEFNQDAVTIYPNPAREEVHIKSSSNINRIEVYDVYGKLMRSNRMVQDKMSLNQFSSGVYLMKIYSDRGAITKKLIVD